MSDQSITSGCAQVKLQPGTPLTLSDSVGMVGEFSDHMSSHLAITPMPLKHGINTVPPNAVAIPATVTEEPIDLPVDDPNNGCYGFKGFGHGEGERMTPDMQRCGHGFHATNGGNPCRWDGGRDCINTCCGGPHGCARSTAGSMNNIQVAAVKDAYTDNHWEDFLVGQEVGDVEDGHGNGNCELW